MGGAEVGSHVLGCLYAAVPVHAERVLEPERTLLEQINLRDGKSQAENESGRGEGVSSAGGKSGQRAMLSSTEQATPDALARPVVDSALLLGSFCT